MTTWMIGLYIALAAYMGLSGRTWGPAIYVASFFLYPSDPTQREKQFQDTIAELAPSDKDPTGVGLFFGAAFSMAIRNLLKAVSLAFATATAYVVFKERLANVLTYLIPYALAPFVALYVYGSFTKTTEATTHAQL
jgi:hypothetical protein